MRFFITLLLVNLIFLNESVFAARKKSPRCSPKAAALIVVNFSESSLRVFVNGRAIGRVTRLSQKKFTKVLAVGDSRVVVSTKTLGTTQRGASNSYAIEDRGVRTCAESRVMLVTPDSVAEALT